MSPTRRALLRGAIPPVLGLSGCLNSQDRRTARTQSRSGSVSDPEVEKPRNPEDGPVVVEAADGSRISGELVTDGSRVEELTFHPDVPDADVESARGFLEATDFDEETVYITQRGIRSCYRLRVESVSWEPRRVEYEYCRELRPPDVRCEADRRESLGLLFRLPAALDMRITGRGSSGRSPCRNVDTEYERIEVDGNATAEAE